MVAILKKIVSLIGTIETFYEGSQLLNPSGGFLKKLSCADFYMKTKQGLITKHVRGFLGPRDS